MQSNFKHDVYSLVKAIPFGRIMTYGQIAALCGHPGAARVVGQIAHFGPSDISWHRLVNKKGGLASGFVPDGKSGQKRLLEQESVKIVNNYLSVDKYIWWPKA